MGTQPVDRSELDLALRAVDGDEEALCELLRRCGERVRIRLKHKIGPQWRSSIDEDDVMQVSYLEAFLLVHKFSPRGEGAFEAWLTQIAENNLRDALRGLQAAKRPDPRNRVGVRSAGSDESMVALVELLGAHTATPSRDAARNEHGSVLQRTLGELPPDYERVVTMYDLEGKSAQEVADHLGRSTGAIYMLRARAHDRLRELMGSESQYFTDAGS